jgi:hypothetical protein
VGARRTGAIAKAEHHDALLSRRDVDGHDPSGSYIHRGLIYAKQATDKIRH